MFADSVRFRCRGVAFVAAMVLLFPLMLLADQPATRPSHDGFAAREGGGRDGGVGRDGGAGLGGRPMGLLDHRFDPTAEVVSSAMEFWQTNSPNRMSLFKLLPEEMQKRRTLELTHRYQTIATFKESSPELFDLLVSQVKLRDDAFQLAKDGKVSELHNKAGQIVDVTLKSRKIRLELLEKELAKQQQDLSADSSDPSKLVDDESARDKLDAERLSHAVQRSHDRTGRADEPVEPVADADLLLFDGTH